MKAAYWISLLFLFSLAHTEIQSAPSLLTDIDLKSYGWQVWGDGPSAEPLLPRSVDFAADGSLWVGYPSEPTKGLIERSTTRPHHLHLLHLSPEGSILASCSLDIPSWYSVMLSTNALDGVTIASIGDNDGALDTLFTVLAPNCKVKSEWSPPKAIKISRLWSTPDHSKLYIELRNHEISMMSSEDLSIGRSMHIAETSRIIGFGNEMAALSQQAPSGRCWMDTVSRVSIVHGETTAWTSALCSEFSLLDDTHLLIMNRPWEKRRTLQLLDSTGSRIGGYIFPKETEVSLVMPAGPQSAPRVVVEVQGSKSHAHIDVIDLLGQCRLLNVPMALGSPINSFALRQDGMRLALLYEDHLKIYGLPKQTEVSH
ncbi:MAG TPA: hypothetical protein VGI45_13245 [Terracidiphilus sp.]